MGSNVVMLKDYKIPEGAGAFVASYAIARGRGHCYPLSLGVVSGLVPVIASLLPMPMLGVGQYTDYMYWGAADAVIVYLAGYASLPSALLSGAATGVGAYVGMMVSSKMA